MTKNFEKNIYSHFECHGIQERLKVTKCIGTLFYTYIYTYTYDVYSLNNFTLKKIPIKLNSNSFLFQKTNIPFKYSYFLGLLFSFLFSFQSSASNFSLSILHEDGLEHYVIVDSEERNDNVLNVLTALNDTILTSTNVPITIDVLKNDISGDIDIASVSTSGGLLIPSNGIISNINQVDGSITYLPENSFSGLDSFEYKVCNNGGTACDTAKVFVTILCPNTPAQNDIYGTIFRDRNEDGNYGTEEKGKGGITVNLYEDNSPKDSIPDGAAIQTMVTDSLGNYNFSLNLTYSTTGQYIQDVASGCDDAREGNIGEDSSDIGKDKNLGVRFSGVTIPAGATIDSAFIFFIAAQNTNKLGSVDIYGHDVSTPEDFCPTADIVGRTKTTLSQEWNFNTEPDWLLGTEYQTSNIKTVVDELTTSYTYNNAEMVFLLISDGVDHRAVRMYEHNGDGSSAPRLEIHYSIPGGEHHYLVKPDLNSLSDADSLTTDSIQFVTFNSNGTASCENNFGINGTDFDQDGISDLEDIDDDNDGIPDVIEICGIAATDFSCLSACTDCDPSGDDDFDGILNYKDPDFCTLNSEGVCETMDIDFDGIPNHLDLDSDNDGIPDLIEAGGIDTIGNGHLNYPTANDPSSMIDTDGDGLADEVDEICSITINETRYADSQTNFGTVTTPDGAVSTTVGFATISETIPHSYITLDLTDTLTVGKQACVNLKGDTNGQPFAIEVSLDGTTFIDASTNGSGNATTTFENYCISHTADFRYVRVINIDDGGAAKAINVDFVQYFLENILCGNTGTALAYKNSDNDDFSDYLDLDSDNDGIPDVIEAGGIDHNGDGFVDNSTDADGDGFADVFDPDDDGVFGIDNGEENQPLVKTDEDGTLVHGETAVSLDRDGDDLSDHVDIDSDNDGLPDLLEVNGIDTDGDGRVDIVTDNDNDGFADIYDTQIGGVAPLGDPTSSLLKTSGTDTDADGKADDIAIIYVDGNGLTTDSDGDKLSDHIDLDSDNDGIPDLIEIGGHDLEGDGRVDISIAPWDTDGDGLADLYDITDGGLPLLKTTADTNNDGKARTTAEKMISGGGGSIPTNPDQDMVTNHLDIDSDNDGILDVIEAGGIDSNNDGKYDDGSGGLTDVDKDGLADEVDGDVGNDFIYESANPLIITATDDAGDINTRLEYSGNGTSDSDLDDVPNFLDVDSDNDGIYDNYEAQSTDGYIPPTATDLDGDGLLDVYDINASALQNGLTPFNFNQSSGDTTPDYLDLDSDGDGMSDEQEAWDNIADGDRQYDNLPTCDKIDTDGDGLIDCYDGSIGNASAYAWVGDPADDVNGAPTGVAFTDDLNDVLPNNDTGNPSEPDYRSNLDACAIGQVYYGISEVSGGTTTSYQYDTLTKKHVNGISSGVIRSTAFCEPDGDGWFYFYNPLEPENYLMGVKASYTGGTVNASAFWRAVNYLEIKVEEERTLRHLIGPTEATLAMERDWSIVLKDTFPTGTTFDIKFYFSQAEMDSLDAAADEVEANATGATRTFEWIEKAGGLQNDDITPSGVTGENDITAFDLAGINETNPGLTDGTNASVGNGKNFVQFTNLTSIDGGTAVVKLSYSSILPVELSSFSATENNCKIQLNWTTETEEKFDYFEVQKSEDGQVFKTIKTIQGQGGHLQRNYSLNNITPSDLNYFRLKMVDLDHSFKYSNILSLTSNCSEINELSIYPNPIGSEGEMLNVDFYGIEKTTEITIMDALGRTLKRLTLDSSVGKINKVQIDISDLPIGTFSLRQTNSGQTKLFVKRK